MTPEEELERAKQDELEMRLSARELFDEAENDEADDPSDTQPGNRVAREGGNPASTPVDDLRELARELFNPA